MLRDCEECGHEMSDKAFACPKCGKPNFNFRGRGKQALDAFTRKAREASTSESAQKLQRQGRSAIKSTKQKVAKTLDQVQSNDTANSHLKKAKSIWSKSGGGTHRIKSVFKRIVWAVVTALAVVVAVMVAIILYGVLLGLLSLIPGWEYLVFVLAGVMLSLLVYVSWIHSREQGK